MAAASSDQTLREIAERARAAVAADRCTIYQVDPDRGEVFSRVALGLDQEIRLPLSEGAIGFVVRTGHPIRLRDAYNDPRFDPSIDQRTGYRTKSIVCVPVTDSQGTVLGAIEAINKIAGTFSADDEELLAGFSMAVGEAFEKRPTSA